MWQGARMSMLRDLTDAMVLSGYHEPAVQDVVSQVDWKNAVQMDLRPLIGRYLHGSPGSYILRRTRDHRYQKYERTSQI